MYCICIHIVETNTYVAQLKQKIPSDTRILSVSFVSLAASALLWTIRALCIVYIYFYYFLRVFHVAVRVVR